MDGLIRFLRHERPLTAAPESMPKSKLIYFSCPTDASCLALASAGNHHEMHSLLSDPTPKERNQTFDILIRMSDSGARVFCDIQVGTCHTDAFKLDIRT